TSGGSASPSRSWRTPSSRRRRWRASGVADAAPGAAASIATTTTTTTRSRLVRRRTVLLAALLTYLGVAVLFVAPLPIPLSPEGGGGSLFGARIALVELDGPIIDVDDLLRELKGHRDNPMVKAGVVRINSPGGGVGPTPERGG